MCHTVAMTATAHSGPPLRPLEVPPPAPRSSWDAWGTDPARLPAGAKAIVAALLPGKPHPVARRAAPRLTPSRLAAGDVTALEAAAGSGDVRIDDAGRLLHLGGKSTPDLLRRRLDDPQTAPDAVVSAAGH